MVSDIHIDQTLALLKTLTQKLYKMNPGELAKTPGATISSRISDIFKCPAPPPEPSLSGRRSTLAMLAGLEPDYEGDRVYAVMYGLFTMLHLAYNNKCDLFMLDFLNAQNFYNSARNIEILVWRLKTRRTSTGRLCLITNTFEGDVSNLSFERIFGKLIALSDSMALIMAEQGDRFVKQAVHIAGMSFLPVGL
ncbi:MAG: hypothetical protein CSA25_01925 [Desulfobacter postgatei]|uniref:Uncharacterized protein n=1 Tax=Desulfobacter postgatei TaxID=2293 RepID=A0A2G6MSN3_9BACT|nr:MAG: hypothetical protein CSA25_01925 [Desulfobacter postgatei]